MSKRQRVECSPRFRNARHFVPGYDRAVPPGQKPFAHPWGASFITFEVIAGRSAYYDSGGVPPFGRTNSN